MADETLLVALLGGLHLLGFGFAALLLLPCLRDESVAPHGSSGEDGDGGGGNDRLRPTPSDGPRGGGIPLPDAQPARVRLRDGRRLADLRPRVERRPAHLPAPTPVRAQPPARRERVRVSGTY
jgi:hypothetical protein